MCWLRPGWLPPLPPPQVGAVLLVAAGWLQGHPRAGGDSSTTRVGATTGRGRARSVPAAAVVVQYSMESMDRVVFSLSLRASLCVSGVLLGQFVFTWVLGLLAVYAQPFATPLPQLFESGFAILYATMGGFAFIVFCLNSKVGHAALAFNPAAF